jgi:putative lipase involved disintegration of autophagic bodies
VIPWQWDFTNYQPDVVTVCLGQNDGVQDSTIFCSAYVNFLKRMRSYYPTAQIILVTSSDGGSVINGGNEKIFIGYQSNT